MKTKIKTFLKILLLTSLLTLPALAFAQTPLDRLEGIGEQQGGYAEIEADQNDIYSLIGQTVSVFLSILGIIFLILMLYGGYTYMLAAGDQGKVEKAINIIRRGIIGLLITFGAYALTQFVLFRLLFQY